MRGASVYNSHLREPVTPTPIAELLAVELSLPAFTTEICRGWDSNTQPSACGANALTVYNNIINNKIIYVSCVGFLKIFFSLKMQRLKSV